MDINLLKSAVDYAIERLRAGKPVVKCPKECINVGCQFDSCLENGLMADYYKELATISRKLDSWLQQTAYCQSWQHLNNLDTAIHNLQLVHELDADHYDRLVVIILNGQPHVLDFNPALANDLQRLLHRQIAMHYADDIE